MQRETLVLPNYTIEVSLEEQSLRTALELDPTELEGRAREEYDTFVTIVTQFSRTNPDTGQRETISPSRMAAIPAITARHLELMRPARGSLTLKEIQESWFGNMPHNDGLRHPDLLFDMAQYNFGSDGPVDEIVRSLTLAEIRRKELIDQYRSMARNMLTEYRYTRDLNDDTPDEFVDEIDDIINDIVDAQI